MIVQKLNLVSQVLSGFDSEIKGSALVAQLEKQLGVPCPHAMLYDLLSTGLIHAEKRGPEIGNYTFRIDKEKVSKLDVLEEALKNYLYFYTAATDQLVWSYPKDFGFEDLIDIMPLYPTLCTLISESKKSILIVNPYFDEGGVEKIASYVKAAVARGVAIRIVTGRDFSSADLRDAENSFSKFLMSASLNKAGGAAVRTFFGSQKNLTYSVHAKFMVFDEKKAYIGSANLTQRSLSVNVEMGMVFSDAKVATLVRAFKKIWDAGKEINLTK